MARLPGSTGLAGSLYPVAHRPQPPCRALLRMAYGLVSDERSEDHAPSDPRGHPSRCERIRSAHYQKAVVRIGPGSRVRGTRQDGAGCKGGLRNAPRFRSGHRDPVGTTPRIDTLVGASKPFPATTAHGAPVRPSGRCDVFRAPLRPGRFPSAGRSPPSSAASGGPPVMPENRRTPWLLCYDIADPRRLQRVHRAACRHAVPLQYSVFHATATRREVLRILREIEDHIDPRRDDVRAYPLARTTPATTLGLSRLAHGVALYHSEDASPPGAAPLPTEGQLEHATRDVATHLATSCVERRNLDEAS